MSAVNKMNGGRASTSPVEKKANGGVALPAATTLSETERAANVYSPFNAGMPQNKATAPVNKNGVIVNGDVKLSAGASPFKPGSANVKPPPVPIRILNRDSTADNDQPTIVTSPTPADTQEASSKDKGKEKAQTAQQQPIGTLSDTRNPIRPTVWFTTDIGAPEFQGSHYVKIEGVGKADHAGWEVFNEDFDWQSKLYDMKSDILSDGKRFVYYAAFDDIRYADAAHGEIEMSQNGWKSCYISQPEYANAKNGGKVKGTRYHDGQVIFVVNFDGATADFKPEEAEKAVHAMASDFGELRAFTELCTASFPQLEFRAEYYAITDGQMALQCATKENPMAAGKDEDWKVYAKMLPDYGQKPYDVDPALKLAAKHANNGHAIQIACTPHRNGDGTFVAEYSSPTGRSAWRIDENGKAEASKPMRTVPKLGPIPFGVPVFDIVNGPNRARYMSDPQPTTPNHLMHGINMGPRSGSWNGHNNRYNYSHGSPRGRSPVSGPQAVEIHKIENGQDVRTTVMLRNIPNRMNCHDLKKVLDAACFGKYDFSYLRIDFEKGTNVGYAFVNFSDPVDIIPFVKNYVDKRWQPNNPRCVELSYATVQGYDCLVEKFRNSAIMEEFQDYRPKLWFTDETAPMPNFVGTEIQFPGPNNMSKRQRSHDNAGQIGLYAPRSGHMSRERGRRSQYDRGTPAQMQEDAYYYQHMSPVQQGYPYGHGHGGYSYPNQGYNMNMAPRMMGPPPQFAPVMYGNGNGYGPDPYMQNGGFMHNQAYGFVEHADPFGPGGYNAGYANGNGYSNGYNNFGMAPDAPASRLRTVTNGRLGGRPKKITSVGGPVQSPDGTYNGYGSPEGFYAGPMPQVVEADENLGYNNTPGPHYCPKY